MENSEVELARFKKKAHGYRAAHELAPSARALEALAVGGIVAGYCRKKGLTRKDVVIADLMAGTGFLSEQLYLLGFRKLHAFEASNDMSKALAEQGSSSKHIDLHPFATLNDISTALKTVKPQVIVCMAGFHHLIEYEADQVRVNANKSIALQERVVSDCMSVLGDEGMLLLVDVYENDVQSEVSEQWPYWRPIKALGTFQNGSLIPNMIKKDLLNAKSFRDYATVTKTHLCSVPKKVNPSLDWFRNVVDLKSQAGHKDIAFSRGFLKRMGNKYNLSFATIECPWIFLNRDLLQKYLITFWFEDAEIDGDKVRQIVEAAEKTNGVCANGGGYASFGWNLGYAVIENRVDRTKTSRRAVFRRLKVFLLVLVVLCFGNGCLKYFTYLNGIYEALDKVITALLGAVGNEVIAEWHRYTEGR